MTVHNTTPIQVQSVVNFMGVLGYTLDRSRANGSFVNIAQVGKAANRHISFRTATKLHNGKPEDWLLTEDQALGVLNLEGVELNTAFRPVAILLAYASKLVVESKVQFDRRGNVVMNAEGAHLVKPLNQLVANMVAGV